MKHVQLHIILILGLIGFCARSPSVLGSNNNTVPEGSLLHYNYSMEQDFNSKKVIVQIEVSGLLLGLFGIGGLGATQWRKYRRKKKRNRRSIHRFHHTL